MTDQFRQSDVEFPESFGDAGKDDYLGNPEVVTRLVGEFAANMENLMMSGANAEAYRLLARRYADIFSNRDPNYTPIVGYHGGTLGYKLMADLGEFWRTHRDSWNDDPLCVFFEWLGVHIAQGIKTADGDDMLLGVMLRPVIQQSIQTLLGIEERRGTAAQGAREGACP